MIYSVFWKKKLKFSSFETNKSPEEAIQKLRETEEMLNKKSEFIETKIAAELANAKKFGTKNKRQALNALKKKNRLQKQQEQIGSFFLKILITKIKNFRQHFDNNRIPARSSWRRPVKREYSRKHEYRGESDEERVERNERRQGRRNDGRHSRSKRRRKRDFRRHFKTYGIPERKFLCFLAFVWFSSRDHKKIHCRDLSWFAQEFNLYSCG